MIEKTKDRIVSIDIVRGIAMVIMALGHVRDYLQFKKLLITTQSTPIQKPSPV
jgi:uncharacterized membrane protein